MMGDKILSVREAIAHGGIDSEGEKRRHAENFRGTGAKDSYGERVWAAMRVSESEVRLIFARAKRNSREMETAHAAVGFRALTERRGAREHG